MKGWRSDRYGIRAYVKVGGMQKTKRFKHGTKTTTIQHWRDETRVALRKRKPLKATGTLAAEVQRYLEHMKPLLLSYKSRVCEIEAWLPTFGEFRPDEITREMILDERQRWLTDEADPKAPKTCNHRVRALRHFYHYVYGSKADTPCDDIPKLKEPDAQPQFVTVSIIRRVAHKLADPKTRARFMVLASTGQRPSQVKRAQPRDVNLRKGYWLVRPAKGGNPIPITLTADMIAAWKAFAAAHAWGDFDGSDYARELRAAGWPKDVRPYNTKHTVAITLAGSNAEWEDIKDWFGHTDVKTTRIYTGLILKRLKNTSAKLDGRLGWGK